jgi:hypothetical protein
VDLGATDRAMHVLKQGVGRQDRAGRWVIGALGQDGGGAREDEAGGYQSRSGRAQASSEPGWGDCGAGGWKRRLTSGARRCASSPMSSGWRCARRCDRPDRGRGSTRAGGGGWWTGMGSTRGVDEGQGAGVGLAAFGAGGARARAGLSKEHDKDRQEQMIADDCGQLQTAADGRRRGGEATVVEAPAQGRFWRRGPSKRARAPPQPPNGRRGRPAASSPPPAATPTSEHQQQGDVLRVLFLWLLLLLLLLFLSLAVLLSCAGERAGGGRSGLNRTRRPGT